jgi:hypothetical protein
MSDFATLFLEDRIVVVFGRISLTDVLLLTQTPDEFKSLLSVANRKGIS